jgi:MFS family permease
MVTMQKKQKFKMFYGYWIVLVAFLCNFVWSGFAYYSFSLFVKSLETDFSWHRGEVMLGFSIFFLASGLVSPFIGKLITRYGERKIITVGAVIMSVAMALLGSVTSIWQFYIFHALVGIGMAGMGTIPASSLVSKWFHKRRGLAIGIMAFGVGIGGFVAAPIVAGTLIPAFGWRLAYVILGIATCLIMVPSALIVIKAGKPADMGLYPDGIEPAVETAQNTPSLTLPTKLMEKAAFISPAFWLIAVCIVLSQFSMVGVCQNQVPFLVDIGFPMQTAAGALGFLALMSAVGKLGFGWLCDRVQAKYVTSIGLALQVIGIIILLNINKESSALLPWLFAITMGLGVGSWLPTMSMLVSQNFGLILYPTIFGIITLCQCLGASAGPAVTGWLYDVMGNYKLAFLILLGLYVIALPAILFVRQPLQSVEKQPVIGLGPEKLVNKRTVS